MKISLIYPSQRKSNPSLRWRQPRHHKYPGLGLLIVASLCPPFAQVKIIDDDYDSIDYDEFVDVVGISILTMNANRAYEIAAHFRDRNITVVLGGLHVSACPEEAQIYADAIVIGEAEDTWPALLRDLNSGSMKKVYRSTNNCSLAQMPRLQRELLKTERYLTINTVQASRGCPMNCEFCSMTSILGDRTRMRPVEEVIDEIKSFKGKYFVLNDENVAQKVDYYKELFQRIIPLKKRWAGQASSNIIKDKELLQLVARSGCAALHVGFESFHTQEGVKKIPKGDVHRIYNNVVETIHGSNICVFGAFVLGFDADTPSIFDTILQFALDSRMEIAQFNILTPYPGTRLYQRLSEENRLLEKNWNNYISGNLCFQLKNMSREFFLDRFQWLKRSYYTYRRIASRLVMSVGRVRLAEFGLLLGINLGYKRGIKTYKV